MSEIHQKRQEAQKALLDLFTDTTELPAGLYEQRSGHPELVISDAGLNRFRSHCKLIQSFPDGKRLCDSDQCTRADHSFRNPQESLVICHAGMWNQVIPIRTQTQVRGTLIFGEMLVTDSEYEQKSIDAHQRAVERLNLTPEQAEALRNELLSTKRYTLEQITHFRHAFARFQEWFYALNDEENRIELSVERVTHEIQTRLQAVIAKAENLAEEIVDVPLSQARAAAHSILTSTLALDTVIQTLGEYLEEYRFAPISIGPVLRDAKRIYEEEARSRGIEIIVDVPSEPLVVDASRDHLQHAVNNLLHNAVKYSFRTVPGGRERFVRLKARPDQDRLLISISNYGVGILPEEIARKDLFKRNYQGRLTQGEFRTGSGKGLYFVSKVVQRHDGTISVESEQMSSERTPEGQPHNNRFTISIPLRRHKKGSTDGEDRLGRR